MATIQELLCTTWELYGSHMLPYTVQGGFSHTAPIWLPYNSHVATTQLLYDYHAALMWYTVIPIQLPYTTALTCRVVGTFPCGYHTTPVWFMIIPIWLPYTVLTCRVLRAFLCFCPLWIPYGIYSVLHGSCMVAMWELYVRYTGVVW